MPDIWRQRWPGEGRERNGEKARILMRTRDPHEDPPTKRRPAPYRGPPVTLGHMRALGCRRLLIYCSTGLCHHSAIVEADHWGDQTAIRDLCSKAVCTRCGMIGADVRPDWSPHVAG